MINSIHTYNSDVVPGGDGPILVQLGTRVDPASIEDKCPSHMLHYIHCTNPTHRNRLNCYIHMLIRRTSDHTSWHFLTERKNSQPTRRHAEQVETTLHVLRVDPDIFFRPEFNQRELT